MSARQGCKTSRRVFGILFLIGVIARPAASSPVIPAERTAAWAPGVSFRGGIPARTTLINATDAPYNATGDGVTDNTSAIQAAINAAAANQVVYVPTGKYLCNGTLNLKKSNVSLRGDGPNATIINYTGTGVAISAAPYITSWSARQAVTSAVTQGANQITVANAAGIAVGDIIVISQINPSYATLHGNNGLLSWGGAPDASGGYTNDTTRGMMQVDLVTAVSGATLTLERPLYLTFAPSQSPAINSMTPAYGIGIENLQILRSGVGGDEPNVNLATLAESWVSNIASVQTSGTENYAHVMLTNDYACEVRDSWFQGGGINGSGLDYGVYIVNNASENLVENNVFVGMRHSMIIAAGASGNVYGYNYTSGPWESNYPNDQTGDQDSHGGETYMNLWEGNIAENFWMDDTWGGNAFNTGFRDWCIAYSTAGQNDQDWNAIALDSNTYSANVVGMVLGRPGASNIDYSLDSGAQSTAFIQGNYSFQTGKTLWISGPVTLPASLYYGSKPAWWGGVLAWPAIGPDVSPVNGAIPAQQRFLATVVQRPPQDRTAAVSSSLFLKSTIIPKSGTVVLTFGVPVAGDVAIEIYSMSGRTMSAISKPGLVPGTYEERLNAAVFPAGVYCCKLRVKTAMVSHVMQVAR